jgi:hypothetical protein
LRDLKNIKHKKIYSGKKKKHSIKTQVLVNKSTKKILLTSSCNGRKHDFKQFKQLNLHFHKNKQVIADTEYKGLKKIHKNSKTPVRKRRNISLTKEEKEYNKQLSKQRMLVENIIREIKIFKIVADKYRNRRKRFGLRFNLIAGIYNYEL